MEESPASIDMIRSPLDSPWGHFPWVNDAVLILSSAFHLSQRSTMVGISQRHFFNEIYVKSPVAVQLSGLVTLLTEVKRKNEISRIILAALRWISKGYLPLSHNVSCGHFWKV